MKRFEIRLNGKEVTFEGGHPDNADRLPMMNSRMSEIDCLSSAMSWIMLHAGYTMADMERRGIDIPPFVKPRDLEHLIDRTWRVSFGDFMIYTITETDDDPSSSPLRPDGYGSA